MSSAFSKLLVARVDLTGLNQAEFRTTDVNGDLMVIPQGFVVQGGSWSVNRGLETASPDSAILHVGIVGDNARYVADLIAKTPVEPNRGFPFRQDGVYGDDNLDQAGRILRVANASLFTWTNSEGPIILTVALRGYMRH